MRQLGIYLMIFGIGAMILPLFDLQFSILAWIDNWGETVGWIIRGGMIALGLVLFLVGKPAEEEGPAEASE